MHTDFRVSVEEFRKYKRLALASALFYKNPHQPYKSDHNMQHALTVLLISLSMKHYLDRLYEKTRDARLWIDSVDTDAIALASFLHDSQREGDILESLIALQKHGQLAADYIMSHRESLLLLLGRKSDTIKQRKENEITLQKAAEICLHHEEQWTGKMDFPEFLLVAASDRATLPRIMISYHDGESLAATAGIRSGIYKLIVQTRAEKYEDSAEYPKGFPHLIQKFLDIGAALCLLSSNILLSKKTLSVREKFSPDRQWEAVEKAALELALLRK
ncbi:MAG TPA: hypothetical protein VN711_02200 [Candidatus Saccharimonadales bacterium]|nr:hypothetical protein [Candidatus Saccharimonadales bacterium]